MKVQLVSHASVLIESDDCVVWTDPWLTGKVFNDSWSLLPSAAWDNSVLGKIDYIWISHEHPDHFNIPTLRLLPEWFKRKVTILFQDLSSTKMVKAFMELGFCNVRLLGHRRIEQLRPGTRAYCYYVGLMDSCLAVSDGMHTVFDVNDAQLTSRDCRRIVADIGAVDALLNQFSIAFYSGLLDHQEPLRRMAIGILNRMYRNHVDLKAQVTIPFASLMYFSSTENKYINEFHNTPARVFEQLGKAGADVVVLYPGDTYELGQMHDSARALARYEKTYAQRSYLPYDVPAGLEFDRIAQAFSERVEHLHENYPAYFLRLLRPVRVRITDLGIDAFFSVPERSLKLQRDKPTPTCL